MPIESADLIKRRRRIRVWTVTLAAFLIYGLSMGVTFNLSLGRLPLPHSPSPGRVMLTLGGGGVFLSSQLGDHPYHAAWHFLVPDRSGIGFARDWGLYWINAAGVHRGLRPSGAAKFLPLEPVLLYLVIRSCQVYRSRPE